MTTNEIEVKLVLDQSQLKTTELSEDLMDDIKQSVCESYSLESAIESYIGNSELYYLPDTVEDLRNDFEEQDSKYDSLISDMQHTLNEYDFDQMQDDINRDEEDIADLKDRVNTLEGEAGLDWRTEFGDRLDTVEDKLSTNATEEYAWESFQGRILELEKSVAKLEEINLRLFNVMKNINGWQVLTNVENG